MIHVVMGELSDQRVDALMRPVRSDLAAVSAASRDLVLAAGEELEARLQQVGVVPVGGAVLTPAGRLAAGFLIHAVVMSEEEPQSSTSVERAVRNGLRRAADWGLGSLAVPPIGLSAGTADPESSARALVGILFDHLDEGISPSDLVIVVSSDFELELFSRLVEETARVRSAGTS